MNYSDHDLAEIKNRLEQRNEPTKLTPNTVRSYISRLKAYCGKQPISTKCLTDFEKVKEYLNSFGEDKKSNKNVTFNAFLCIVSEFYKDTPLMEMYSELHKQEFQKTRQNYFKKPDEEVVEKISEVGFTYDKVYQAFDASCMKTSMIEKVEKQNEWNDVLTHICLCFYTYLPPLRHGEIASLSFSNEHDNWIDFENNNLVIRNHKTVSTYGCKKIDMPTGLREELLRHRDRIYSEWVFCQFADREKRVVDNKINDILQRALGKGIGSRILRSVYVSTVLNTANAVYREEVARIMGHSINTQTTIYSQFDPTLHPQNTPEETEDNDSESREPEFFTYPHVSSPPIQLEEGLQLQDYFCINLKKFVVRIDKKLIGNISDILIDDYGVTIL
jgi:hypothetical protein